MELLKFNEHGQLNKNFYLSRDINVLKNDELKLKNFSKKILFEINRIKQNFKKPISHNFVKIDSRQVKMKKAPKLKFKIFYSILGLAAEYLMLIIAALNSIFLYWIIFDTLPFVNMPNVKEEYSQYSGLLQIVAYVYIACILYGLFGFMVLFLSPFGDIVQKTFKYIDSKIPRVYEYASSDLVKKVDKELELVCLTNQFIINYNWYSRCSDSLDKKFKKILDKSLTKVSIVLASYPEFIKKAKKREQNARLAALENNLRNGSQSIRSILMNNLCIPFQCPYCENFEESNNLEADHIIPITMGGQSRLQNMVMVCKDCNQKKSAFSLRHFCRREGFNFDVICDRLENMGKIPA